LAHLADSAASWDHNTTKGIGGNRIDNGRALVGGEKPLGVSQISWRFDDRLHRSRYYGIAVCWASPSARRAANRIGPDSARDRARAAVRPATAGSFVDTVR